MSAENNKPDARKSDFRSRRALFLISTTAILIVAALGVLRAWRISAFDPNELSLTEMKSIGKRFSTEKTVDTESLIAELHRLSVGPTNLADAAYMVTRILTTEGEEPPKKHSREQQYLHLDEQIAGLNDIGKEKLSEWITQRLWVSATLRFTFKMAQDDVGNTRNVLRYFLNSNERIPYFDLLIMQAAKALDDYNLELKYRVLELDESSKNEVRKMFLGDRMIKWAKSLKVELKEFSGGTNTVLGMYDWLKYEPYGETTGFGKIPRDADYNFDLGGGFATPDISRLVGVPFTSLDIVSPRMAEKWNLRFLIAKSWNSWNMGLADLRLETDDEKNSYRVELRNQPWQDFDIFKNRIPLDREKYVITSFGFISSTVGSSSLAELNKVDEFVEYYRTSYAGVRRIIELVAAGKDVTFFTYQRASSKRYKYRTVYMRFKNHQLTEAIIWPNGNRKKGILKRREANGR